MVDQMNNEIDTDRLNAVKLLVLDVDGVLTDGRFIIMPSGEEYKPFNAKDGSGIKYWIRAGGTVAFISGRDSAAVAARAEELGVDIVRQGCKRKAPVLTAVLDELEMAPGAVMVVGDDLPDLPLFDLCGLTACPADAVDEVREAADYVCRARGGDGCVREVVELLLKGTGRWDTIMQRYRPNGDGDRE